MESDTFRIGKGKYELSVTVIFMGEDILVGIGGGDRPHIGSISVSSKGTFASEVLTGHKDNFVGDVISRHLSDKLEKTVAVSCGIHIDGASKEDINKILGMIPEIEERILSQIKSQ